MSNISLSLLLGYLAVSLYYLIKSANPSERCEQEKPAFRRKHGSSCAKPFLSSFESNIGTSSKDRNHRLVLELWTQFDDADDDDHSGGHGSLIPKDSQQQTQIRQQQRQPHHLKWILSSTCPPIEIDLSQKVFEKLKFGGKGGNCTVEFPKFSRVRGEEEQDHRHGHSSDITNYKTIHKPTTYKAKFVLKYIDSKNNMGSSYMVLAQTIFDLTRLVEHNRIKVPYFKYYKQPVVLRLIMDDQLYPIHHPVRGDGYVLKLYHPQISHDDNVYHLPTFYVDDVALKHSSHIQLAPPPQDDKVHEPRPPTNLSIQLSIISPLRHVFHRQLEIGFTMLENILNADEIDEIRHMISDEYIYRFILTQIISMVHIYLDYMAFRDEVSFYVGKKSMGGISFSSVLGRFICQFIIFLYLCDGGNTSWLVLSSIGSGVLVELWKVFKFIKPKFLNSFPFVVFQTGSAGMSQLEKDTVNYDTISRTYLCMLLYPLVIGSAIYAKKFYVYSSWWSWLISNLANAVYTFGFITLCPQLYVNYKLKSVAHLPWKVFVYKIFNTFVDDVFAFMIQMPLKHKLMTLRDDVVFFVFLIQAYLYRVDKSRTNEFGYAYDDDGDDDDHVVQEDTSSSPDDIKEQEQEHCLQRQGTQKDLDIVLDAKCHGHSHHESLHHHEKME
mmetsp:Transcript_5270/g.10056  ORF Transcript_5270/g.10056 Transcript_5270/m.10056 type:complete len:665 (+) Transcript_5270:102-2096(+)